MDNKNTLLKNMKWLLSQPYDIMGIFMYTYVRSYLYRRYFKAIGTGFYADLFLMVRGPAAMIIGDRFRAGRNLWLECVQAGNDRPLLTIGHHFTASNDVHIACSNRVTLGNGVLLGSHVLITDHSHGCYNGCSPSVPDSPPLTRPIYSNGPVEIGHNVWIGDNVVVLPNVRIGNGSVIGASSVVAGDIDDHTIACGIPARPVKRYNPESREWESIGVSFHVPI